ncbi:MAG TPA: carboxypeptidase-like regulatory domain-containing protein, partial [Terriglobia bacterium]|nr:carboxypeptidase-like regulatory domain-containing protein [Terriglobia bacterium]
MKATRVFCAYVLVVFVCLPVFAQLNSGSINGGVTDPTGAVIPGVTVTVTDVERGVSRTLLTDEAGQYLAPSLTPGTYSVRGELAGFQTVERKNIVVGVGQGARVDLQLQAGAQNETVTVSESAPLIDTSNEVISNTVETAILSELPINGRLYTKVLDFQPGIVGRPGGNSPNYSANGAGTQGNYWMLDGVENLNIFVNSGPLIGAGTSTDELTILPADAIQEVNVMANPPAEFGWFQGAVVNVGLKSGTNAIHGSVYGFGRNNALEAYNPYQNGITPRLPKADDNFWQYGASVSGPIRKDRLFYFGNYEGMRYKVGAPSLINTPTTSRFVQTPDDSLPLAIEGLIAHGVAPNPLSLNLAGCTVAGGQAACDPSKGIFPSRSSITENIPIALDN